MNPDNVGLPRVSNVYGLSFVDNNGASAMCVACHFDVNRPMDVVDIGRSSHFVYNTFNPGSPRLTQTPDTKERTSVWTAGGGAAPRPLSKYGDFSASPKSVTGTYGEMICESCHNLILNVAGGNNLVENSFPWDSRPGPANTLISTPTTTLCEGCHVSATLPGHHPMTDEFTSYGTPLSNTDVSSQSTRVYADNTLITFGPRAGTLYNMPAASTSETFYQGPNRMGCLSCHGNGHSGYTGTGARLLRAGWAGPKSLAPVSPGMPVVGTAATGVDRQFERGANRLITNWQPLCDACHKVDD